MQAGTSVKVVQHTYLRIGTTLRNSVFIDEAQSNIVSHTLKGDPFQSAPRVGLLLGRHAECGVCARQYLSGVN